MKVVKKCLTALLLINLHKKCFFVAFVFKFSYIRKMKMLID